MVLNVFMQKPPFPDFLSELFGEGDTDIGVESVKL
jgi:hypothetical protein